MEALKCHFTRALISVMGVNPTVGRNENKNIITAGRLNQPDFIKALRCTDCTSMQEDESWTCEEVFGSLQ